MQPTPPRRPRAPRALPWLVLAVHLAALLLVAQALRPHERRAAAAPARPLWLRLLPAPRQAAPVPPAPEAPVHPPAEPPRPSTGTAARRPPPPAAPPPSAQAITLPAAEAPALPLHSATTATTSAHTPEPPASAPLDLRLPTTPRPAPPSAAALARDDPRANTPRPGSEERMAKTLGTDLTLRESADPDGTRYFRRGRDCVVARPARESQLNPFNQGARPTPRLVEKC